MSLPKAISDLIERFERNRESYKSPHYNETQLRREFLDPFFKTLGWDVDNEQGYAEAYKDVIHEDAIKIGGGVKAPDFCFRIGGARKFFLEAKKPSVSIKDEPSPAYQLRRYAWSAKLPLSILSDFEELAVYDCRIRPDKSDKASAARIFYCTASEYAEKWDWIAGHFSRDAVLKGSFDKYAESAKAKKGTAEVDTAFLAEIENWRKMLAGNLALRNAALSQRELNFAVQRIIDRIIFLRICEDRGIENYGQLLSLINGNRTYTRLCQMFQSADDRYNSGLFHFKKEKDRHEAPDELTLDLQVDDKLLREILAGLYYPDSPYEFSVLPADILGQVYEQFLGKVIRLTPGHRAVIDDKPEVKKAGGVYYTPTYIVDYIVRQTVGKLAEGKTPAQVAKMRIVDPACGSGSFLIGAYQYLLDWHRDWYMKDDPAKWAKGRKPALVQAYTGEWRLTIDERKRILLNNIYGVDIDSQAVEVTKLSLLLKVLEGETEQSLQTLRLFHGRALPDLGDNIKCGNSLIGPDFYEQQMLPLDEDERLRINVFDWQAEFSEVFKAGGFDAVIGNPPYIRMESFKELKDYLKAHASIESIVDLAGLPVFKGATVRTIILMTSLKANKISSMYAPPMSPDLFDAVQTRTITIDEAIRDTQYEVATNALAQPVWSFRKRIEKDLLKRLQELYAPLIKYCNGQIGYGIKSGLEAAFVIDENVKNELVRRNKKAEEIIKPYLNGKDVRRYGIDFKNTYLIYTYHGIDIKKYPSIEDYLKQYKERLQKRATKQEWFELQQPQFNYAQYFESPKITFPDIALNSRFAIDNLGYYGSTTTFFIPCVDFYLLGVLNSRLGNYYFMQTCAALEGRTDKYLRFKRQYVEGLPVRPIDIANKTDKSRHDRMVALIEQMLALHAAGKNRHRAPDRCNRQANRQACLRALRSHTGRGKDCGGKRLMKELRLLS
ncbi:MAG TPA: TaqI-like C-terminal specificity domain-containing protein [Dissulfurispiraceae bacterium]|nr:TaqI-like C-terminal specificity domain-containing protein [Dissulfurispiraceae bacterium]